MSSYQLNDVLVPLVQEEHPLPHHLPPLSPPNHHSLPLSGPSPFLPNSISPPLISSSQSPSCLPQLAQQALCLSPHRVRYGLLMKEKDFLLSKELRQDLDLLCSRYSLGSQKKEELLKQMKNLQYMFLVELSKALRSTLSSTGQ